METTSKKESCRINGDVVPELYRRTFHCRKGHKHTISVPLDCRVDVIRIGDRGTGMMCVQCMNNAFGMLEVPSEEV